MKKIFQYQSKKNKGAKKKIKIKDVQTS